MIQRWESCRLVAYQDSNGVWTIGWGHTGKVGAVDIGPGLEITQVAADAIFQDDLTQAEQAVENLLAGPANQDQFDAMVSLTYNAGRQTFHDSAVLQRFNAGDYSGAAEAFSHIVWSGARILEGLVHRRASEIVRWFGG